MTEPDSSDLPWLLLLGFKQQPSNSAPIPRSALAGSESIQNLLRWTPFGLRTAARPSKDTAILLPQFHHWECLHNISPNLILNEILIKLFIFRFCLAFYLKLASTHHPPNTTGKISVPKFMKNVVKYATSQDHAIRSLFAVYMITTLTL